MVTVHRRGQTDAGEPIRLLPGPVALRPGVAAAWARPHVHHRSEQFTEQFERVRQRLGRLAGGMETALLFGGGTLANGMVAATLAASATG